MAKLDSGFVHNGNYDISKPRCTEYRNYNITGKIIHRCKPLWL